MGLFGNLCSIVSAHAYTPHRDDNFGCGGDFSSRELNEKYRSRP